MVGTMNLPLCWTQRISMWVNYHVWWIPTSNCLSIVGSQYLFLRKQFGVQFYRGCWLEQYLKSTMEDVKAAAQREREQQYAKENGKYIDTQPSITKTT